MSTIPERVSSRSHSARSRCATGSPALPMGGGCLTTGWLSLGTAVHVVGDAVVPRRVHDAIAEGRAVARSVS